MLAYRFPILLWFLVSLSSNAAASDEPDRSKQVFDEAKSRFNLGEFETALALFREAYQTAPHPELLFNIAQCHRNLGHVAEAAFFFERYLEERPNAPDTDEVHALLRELRAVEVPPPVTATVTPAAPILDLRPEPIEPEDSVVSQWWFWTLIATGVVIVAGGTALALRAGNDDGLPENPIATFDYRGL